MPASHDDRENERVTRPLSKAIHVLIDTRRADAPFEWDLGLYYLALSLSKTASRRKPFNPTKKCIGAAYHTSFACAPREASLNDTVGALFEGLDSTLWSLDGFIFSVVAGYETGGVVYVANVVARGPAIPGKVCPLCCGGCHFTAKNAAAVFGRLGAVRPAEIASNADSIGGSMSSTTAVSGSSVMSEGYGMSRISGSAASAGSGSSSGVWSWNGLTPDAHRVWNESARFWGYPGHSGYRAYPYR